MGFSNSIFSYQDVRELLDRALLADRGVRIKLSKVGSAHNLRQRMSYYRRLDRAENRKIYKEGDPLYDRSQYDVLIFRLSPAEDGKHTLLDIVKGSASDFDVEEL